MQCLSLLAVCSFHPLTFHQPWQEQTPPWVRRSPCQSRWQWHSGEGHCQHSTQAAPEPPGGTHQSMKSGQLLGLGMVVGNNNVLCKQGNVINEVNSAM